MLMKVAKEREHNEIIAVRGLTKRFGTITAVNNVSFSVAKGEIFGFLGPNGAGKTTTIRMLTGLLTPDAGDILISGVDIQQHPIVAKMKMGIIPEMSNVYVDLIAKQNVILAGRFYGMPKRELETKADHLLAQFELYDRKDDHVETFSKGMKQRVLIASALVHTPEILFLDEPTSGLDVRSQRLIRGIIKEMNESGTTIFLTTHNIEEANLLCDRVGIINQGIIAAIDSPEQLKRTFRQTQSVEVSLTKPIDVHILREINLVNETEKVGDKWKLYTDDPDQLVKYLTACAQEHGLMFTSLEICGASLEDAFVRLTEDVRDAS